jgi:hypothetical protein
MHPDIVSMKTDEARGRVLEIVLQHGEKDEEFEQLVASERGPGVAEIQDAVALAKLAELVDELRTQVADEVVALRQQVARLADELYETKTTKKSTTTKRSKS